MDERTRSAGFAHLVGLLLVGLLLAAACRPPAATPVPSGGVEGVALAGPTCPVERPGQSACIRPVVGAEILIRDSSGTVVARAITNANGEFDVFVLAPGTYSVEPQPVQGLMGTPAAQTAHVTEGSPVVLTFHYDTGIR